MADFDIGKQSRIDIISNGAIVDSSQITDFTAKQETITIKHRPMRSPPITKELPDGWTGSFSLDRLGPIFDNYFAQAEDNYWNDLPDAQIQILQTILERNGAVSQYRYDITALKFDEAGAYKQDDKVIQKISFVASLRHRVV